MYLELFKESNVSKKPLQLRNPVIVFALVVRKTAAGSDGLLKSPHRR